MKWLIPGRSRVLIISFLLLLSAYVTSSQQHTDQKTTPASTSSNETKGVDANHHAKVFYKHTWPVRVFNIHKYFIKFHMCMRLFFRVMYIYI